MDIKGGWCDPNISNDCIPLRRPLPDPSASSLTRHHPRCPTTRLYFVHILSLWIGYDHVFIMSLTYHDYGTFQGHQCAAFAFEALLLLALVWAPSPEISHVH